ncbi:MAG: protein kinase [Ectothiorhodospiraceae bacterium]|nr:protein kinase [Ectothiorhodospiraceae bacterium]
MHDTRPTRHHGAGMRGGAAEAMKGLSGTSVGRYELVRELGYGNMGTVYLARDPFTVRDVAVKVATLRGPGNARLARRREKLFINEAQAAQLLRHPNIVTTMDAGVDGDIHYIVMEYIPHAQTLERYCRPDNLLPVERVAAILLQCALALHYAHSRGVVHRDVKPSNILLTQDGQVKIVDFGVAFIERDDIDSTQVVGALGSPRYMSPEQIVEGVTTTRSDLFSLGSVAYELLTGTHPFAANTVPAVARRIVREPVTPLLQVRADLPEALGRIVDRTLRKLPDERYRTAMDLAGDIGLVHDEVRAALRDVSDARGLGQLSGLRFFAGFETSELLDVLEASTWERFAPGQEILAEGRRGDCFYVVASGKVSVRRGMVEVEVLGPGDSFGEVGLVRPGHEVARVVAAEEATVLRVGAGLIERASVGCQLRFHKAFLRAMARRVAGALGKVDVRG